MVKKCQETERKRADAVCCSGSTGNGARDGNPDILDDP